MIGVRSFRGGNDDTQVAAARYELKEQAPSSRKAALLSAAVMGMALYWDRVAEASVARADARAPHDPTPGNHQGQDGLSLARIASNADSLDGLLAGPDNPDKAPADAGPDLLSPLAGGDAPAVSHLGVPAASMAMSRGPGLPDLLTAKPLTGGNWQGAGAGDVPSVGLSFARLTNSNGGDSNGNSDTSGDTTGSGTGAGTGSDSGSGGSDPSGSLTGAAALGDIYSGDTQFLTTEKLFAAAGLTPGASSVITGLTAQGGTVVENGGAWVITPDANLIGQVKVNFQVVDTISGNVVDHPATFNVRPHLIDGTDGADTLTGGAFVDWIHGGAGNDSLSGAGGHDQLYGDQGDDTFFAAVLPSIPAGEETDASTFPTDPALYSLFSGGDGFDTLDVSAARAAITVDFAAGTAVGDDVGYNRFDGIELVRGGHGDDSFHFAAGNVVVSGGEGNDVFILSAPTGGSAEPSVIAVLDFAPGDKVRIGQYDLFQPQDPAPATGQSTYFDPIDSPPESPIRFHAEYNQTLASTEVKVDVDNNGTFETTLILTGAHPLEATAHI
jgi:hypothetical protein